MRKIGVEGLRAHDRGNETKDERRDKLYKYTTKRRTGQQASEPVASLPIVAVVMLLTGFRLQYSLKLLLLMQRCMFKLGISPCNAGD
ncbi:hypothetical protein [Burkholderia savannae]|uniref:hypothetical protein n=1 Tax=Burkholderia savannae TaxID=1637837 RepID=UPI0012F4B30F|nr:hypothetical protein [Burkholderia savannae]